MRNRHLLCSALALLPLYGHADTLAQIIRNGSVSGDIRSYYFSKLYGAPTKANEDAYSLGGILNARTGSLDGFSAGASFLPPIAWGPTAATAKTWIPP